MTWAIYSRPCRVLSAIRSTLIPRLHAVAWLAYKYFVGWLDGADYILQAIEEAERRAGLASDNDSGFQW
jgi:hypothetical protein